MDLNTNFSTVAVMRVPHNKFISFYDSERGLEYKSFIPTATPQQSQRIVTGLLSFFPQQRYTFPKI